MGDERPPSHSRGPTAGTDDSGDEDDDSDDDDNDDDEDSSSDDSEDENDDDATQQEGGFSPVDSDAPGWPLSGFPMDGSEPAWGDEEPQDYGDGDSDNGFS